MDVQEIREEMNRLKHEETTYSNCSKLAVLCTVLDHLDQREPRQKKKEIMEYSYGSSEFLNVVSRAPVDAVMKILDEHMDAIKVVYPKEYSIIIKRIKEISPI